MPTYTYDIFAKGIEQGGWSGSDTTSRSDRVRDTGYTEITTKFVSPKVTATCNTGKTVQINFYGYNSSKSLLCDLYWYDSPKTFDVSSYSGLKYFRIQLRYSDNSEITPSQITSLKVEVEVPDPWYIDDNGELNINNLAEEISGDILTPPYPASFWDLTNNQLTLNDEDWQPIPEEIEGDILTPPYPASFWYYDNELKRLNMLLLPEEPAPNGIIYDNPDENEFFNVYDEVYDNGLRRLHKSYKIKLEILSDDENTIGEITKDLSLTAAGQITINNEQITRRSCSLSLTNVDNKYIPTKNSPFWLNRKFKLWLGLVMNNSTYWWSQGVFYTVKASATGRILSIEAVDKGGALDGTLKLNMTESQYKFGRGKKITEIIKQTLALDVGNPYGAKGSPIGYGGNKPIDCKPPFVGVEYYGFKTVSDISIDTNSYISDMFIKMAELYAADCYYNTEGYLVFQPHIESTGYTYVPTQWEFTDLSSTFEDVNYEYSFEGENVVTVYTNTTQAGVRNVSWTAFNTNPLSPLNVSTGIRRAPHIEIPYYHNEELSAAQQEAQQIKDCRSTANHYLLTNSMLGMTLNFNAPIIPHMDVNKTIQITDKYADIEDGIYVVQSITIPLSSDKMSISATNINWLPNDMTFSGVSEVIENDNNNGGAEG